MLHHPGQVGRKTQQGHHHCQQQAALHITARQLGRQQQAQHQPGQRHHGLVLGQHAGGGRHACQHPPAPLPRLHRLHHRPGGGADGQHHHRVVVVDLGPHRESLLQAPGQHRQAHHRRRQQPAGQPVGEEGSAAGAQRSQHIGPVGRRPEQRDQAPQQPGGQGRMLVVAPFQAVRPDVLLEVVAPLPRIDAGRHKHPGRHPGQRQQQRPMVQPGQRQPACRQAGPGGQSDSRGCCEGLGHTADTGASPSYRPARRQHRQGPAGDKRGGVGQQPPRAQRSKRNVM